MLFRSARTYLEKAHAANFPEDVIRAIETRYNNLVLELNKVYHGLMADKRVGQRQMQQNFQQFAIEANQFSTAVYREMAVVATNTQERQEALTAMQQRQEINLELMAEHLLAERSLRKMAEAHLRNWTTEKDKEVGILYEQAVTADRQIKDLNHKLSESSKAFEQKQVALVTDVENRVLKAVEDQMTQAQRERQRLYKDDMLRRIREATRPLSSSGEGSRAPPPDLPERTRLPSSVPELEEVEPPSADQPEDAPPQPPLPPSDGPSSSHGGSSRGGNDRGGRGRGGGRGGRGGRGSQPSSQRSASPPPEFPPDFLEGAWVAPENRPEIDQAQVLAQAIANAMRSARPADSGRRLPVKQPDTFDGEYTKFRSWWRQMKKYLQIHQHQVPDDLTKINTVSTFLRGQALLWAEARERLMETRSAQDTWTALCSKMEERFTD